MDKLVYKDLELSTSRYIVRGRTMSEAGGGETAQFRTKRCCYTCDSATIVLSTGVAPDGLVLVYSIIPKAIPRPDEIIPVIHHENGIECG